MAKGKIVAIATIGLSGLAFATLANATLITVNGSDFPNVGASHVTTNTSVGGLRFSPSCHYDVTTNFSAPVIAIDSALCAGPGAGNPDYLGAATGLPARLYIDAGGLPFSLVSLTWATNIESLTSSNGGIFSEFNVSADEFRTTAFNGPAWSSIDWLVWTFAQDPGAPCCGIASLTVDVREIPEPGTLTVASLGLLGVAFARRRHKKK